MHHASIMDAVGSFNKDTSFILGLNHASVEPTLAARCMRCA